MDVSRAFIFGIPVSLVSIHTQWRGVTNDSELKADHTTGVIQLFCALVCLWVLVHHLERSSRLWRPQLTIPGIFLVSGITAAVTAVSLAYDQDSTGASAGVCALLGICPSLFPTMCFHCHLQCQSPESQQQCSSSSLFEALSASRVWLTAFI